MALFKVAYAKLLNFDKGLYGIFHKANMQLIKDISLRLSIRIYIYVNNYSFTWLID